jgi:hypothetical protein
MVCVRRGCRVYGRWVRRVLVMAVFKRVLDMAVWYSFLNGGYTGTTARRCGLRRAEIGI